MYDWINQGAEALRESLVAWRRDFHRYAEVAWMEMRTSSIIARELQNMGYEVLVGGDVCHADSRMGLPSLEALEAHYLWAKENGADAEFVEAARGGFTGVVAQLDCGEGPVVALRFDIDALGVLECRDKTHRPAAEGFASVCPGVMHACGHDGHASIGLGTARLLMQNKNRLRGKIKLIFQPAEEGVCGAKSIVENGHLDHVDYVLGAHIYPAGDAAGYDVGIVREGGGGGLATTKFDIVFCGKSSHAGASPQLGQNAMLAAASAVLNMHAIPRFGEVPTQVNIGRLVAGTARNVVCEEARLEAEVRGLTSEANAYMEAYALRVAEGAARMHACTMETYRTGASAALKNTWALCARVMRICKDELGLKPLLIPGLGSGSEDYSYLSERVQENGGQSAYFTLLADCPAVNHNHRFDYGEEVLVNGVKAFCGTVFDLTQQALCASR